MKKVVKFGGSSLASARQFKKVADIIKSDKSRRYVVPSAPGRRSDKDEKVTDLLYACYDAVAEGRSYKKILEKIKSRYMDIIDGLDLNLNLDHEFDRIEENFLAKAGRDYAASRGEYLNGIVAANFLGFEFVDAAEVIFFDENGNFESEHTNRELSERLEHVEKAVIPGFYGSKPDGTIKTFSRGGSDVTGSIVAKAIHADMYENWTDVSGVLVTDPRIVENPEVIETITYKELRELSYMGASVLHEDAIFPVRKEGIPINIRKYGISFEHMPSGIDTMTVYVHQSEFEEFEQSVIAGIHRAVEPDTVELESDLALIAVVGRGMRSTRGTAGRIFSALAHARVNVKMIDQGSSEWNIIIGVENDDFETAIRAIYDIFVITEL